MGSFSRYDPAEQNEDVQLERHALCHSAPDFSILKMRFRSSSTRISQGPGSTPWHCASS